MHTENFKTFKLACQVHARHSNGHGFSFRERFDSQGKYNNNIIMHNANRIVERSTWDK